MEIGQDLHLLEEADFSALHAGLAAESQVQETKIVQEEESKIVDKNL